MVTVLASASLAAAWSGYQSARWDGVQAASYNQASAHRVESARSSTYGHQLAIVDIITFTSYMDAYIKGDTELADFYMNRFRAGFRPAFDAWMATDPLNNPDAPPSPFAMPEYVVPELQEADRLEAEASVLFQKGQDANQTSDDYVLNTVFLATVLFFAAIAPRVGWVPARVTLITVACLMLAVGLYNVSTYPIE
jgi:hypothetical protein